MRRFGVPKEAEDKWRLQMARAEEEDFPQRPLVAQRPLGEGHWKDRFATPSENYRLGGHMPKDMNGGTRPYAKGDLGKAVQEGCVPEIKRALAAGANPNDEEERDEITPDAISWTPLHKAAAWSESYQNSLEAVWELLKAGADPHIKDRKGMTPYDLAAKVEDVEGCEGWEKAKVDLLRAARIDRGTTLIPARHVSKPPINGSEFSPSAAAIAEIEEKIAAGKRNKKAWHEAQAAADPEVSGAYQKGKLRDVTSRGVVSDSHALSITALAKKLLEIGADPNGESITDQWGREDPSTPLHHAAKFGNLDLVKLLLDAKADPHAIAPYEGKDNVGTPVDWCKRSMHEWGDCKEVVKLLEAAMQEEPPPGGYAAASKELAESMPGKIAAEKAAKEEAAKEKVAAKQALQSWVRVWVEDHKVDIGALRDAITRMEKADVKLVEVGLAEKADVDNTPLLSEAKAKLKSAETAAAAIEDLEAALDSENRTIEALQKALQQVVQIGALPSNDTRVTDARKTIQQLEVEAQAFFARQEMGLIDAAKAAKEVHLISTPYSDVEGREGAVAEKKRLDDPVNKVLCFDPNQDIAKIAEKNGWSKEVQEKKWLQVFEAIKLIITKKRQADPENSSSLRVMCNGQPPPDPENGTAPELLGNAQPGELLGGLSAGFTPQKGSLVWVIYHSTETPHPNSDKYPKGPLDLTDNASAP